MASQVYSAQLFLAHDVTLALVEVPGGIRWVIRTVTIFYPGAVGDSSAQLVDVGSGATLLKDEAGMLSAGAFHYYNDLRIVLDETAGLQVSGTGSPDIGIFGYALTLP